ncbi:TetR/AcrR family transcriptional regulator [Actinokineospora sp. G85]|uniref:TetR/AcrR family transcriptional regulator n=1 Tax=Actinokineospora sp. G85 TaxID=3406626 RepID=UPI003C77552C
MATPGTARPGSRKARTEETRRRLVSAAVDQFSARHYDEVAVSDIAAGAGVAHGLLFHHFQNKRGLYLEAMRHAARELDMVDKVVEGAPFLPQFQKLLEDHLAYLARHRGLALRLVLGGRGADPEAWEVFEAGRWRVIEWICADLGLDPGSNAVRMTFRAAIGAIDEAVAYWLTNDQPYDIPTMADVLIELAFNAARTVARLDPAVDIPRLWRERTAPGPP